MKSIIEESKRIIKNAMNNNKLIVFVGSGVSANSGYPSWKNVIEHIAEKLNIYKENISQADYLKIPQYYFNSMGEKEYNDLVNTIFNINNAKPNSLHSKILDLNPYHIITTNYDCLIEQASAEKGMFLDVVCKDSDLPYTFNNKMIIKMHGDLKNKNFVLKEDDYLNYSQKFKMIETYIKALISTYVILFIGYSINDYNVKYIFQWVKEVLGKDFHRSFFLYADEEKNEFNNIEFDYYKNRGINLLYYSQACLIDDFKKDVNTNDLNDPAGIRTYALINYLLQEDNPETVNINYVYNKIHALNYLQRIRLSDIFKALDDKIVYNVDKADLILFDDKIEQLFNEMNVVKNENKHVETIEKVDIIESIFIKSGIKRIIKKNSDIKKSDDIIYELKDSSIDNYQLSYIFSSFNYVLLDKWVRHNSIHLVEKNEIEYLEKAYALFVLEKYYDSYSLLKYISDSCFKQKKYFLYFLSEFNRWHLGKIITRYFFIGTTNEQNAEIKKEIELIDLDNLYLKLPDKSRKELNFLKDILNFNYVYSTLKEVTSFESKVEKEANTVYFGLPPYGGKIFELESKVQRFWEFLHYNFLMIDNYDVVKQVYYHFIHCVLMSHTIKSESESEDFLGLRGEKVKMSKIDYFAFLIMACYVNLKDLEYLFVKLDIRKIEVDDEVILSLNNNIRNIVESILHFDIRVKYCSLFDSYLYILSKVDIGEDNFICIINEICKMLTESRVTVENYNNIIRFLVGQNNNYKYNIDNTTLGNTIEIILSKIITNNLSESDKRKINDYIRTVSFIIKNVNDNYYLPCNRLIKVLIDNLYEERNDLCSETIIIYLYNICNKGIKARISKMMRKKLDNLSVFDYKYFNLYYEAVMNGIINSNIDYEEKVIKYVDEVISKRETELKSGIYSEYVYGDPIEHHLGLLANLLFNNLIINKQLFDKYKGKVSTFDLLYNIDEFDFENFEIKWLKYFSNSLHKHVSKNKKAKEIIKEKLKLAIIEDECDRRLREIFFEYYD